MQVILENIQGFRGQFTYTIEPGLNVITSMYNGTGKTTFFECMKFLHNPKSFDKVSRKFLRNKHESKATFMLVIDDCRFGFILEGDQYAIVTKMKGETAYTYTQTPHPMLSYYTQVFLTEDSFINICDRFLNLFSASNTAYNHELVNSFLTHASLEKSIELLAQEETAVKGELEYAERNLKYYGDLLRAAKHYRNVDKYREALDCENYILRYESIDEALQLLRRFVISKKPVLVDRLADTVELYEQLLKYKTPSHVSVNKLDELLDIHLNVMEIRTQYDETSVFSLELLTDITAEFLPIKPEFPLVDIEVFDELTDIYTIFKDMRQEPPFILTERLTELVELYEIVEKLCANLDRYSFFKSEEEKILLGLQKFQYDCPVRGKVYVVGGECLSVQNVTQ